MDDDVLAMTLHDETWGRERAVDLLERTVQWAAAKAAEGKYHTHIIRNFGEIATVANLFYIRDSALHLLARAPDEAFVAGLITNISDVSGCVQRGLSEAKAAERWPKYDRTRVVEFARRCGNVERLTLTTNHQLW